MDPSQILHEPWLDRLLAESDPDKRLRLSLDACRALVKASGVALWREVEPGQFAWRREVGETHEGPHPDGVLAVAEGKWDTRQARHEVVVAGFPPHRMAWAISLPLLREEALESLEAFLFLVCTLHPSDDDPEGPSLLA